MTDSGSMRLNGGDLITDGGRVPHDSAVGVFYTDVIADGTGFGNSEPLVRAINTLMTQGSWETLGPFGNRSPAIVVEIEGTNADALNAGEVWLSRLMNPGALEWLPPGQTVWTVFDMVWCYVSRSEDERWDLDETVWRRRYLIPIKALPHARSSDLTVTTAVDTTTDIVVSDGNSATRYVGSRYPASGFSGTPIAIAPAVVSGAVRIGPGGQMGAGFLVADYTFATAIPADTPYLRVDARSYLSLLTDAPTYFKVGGVWVSASPSQRSTVSTGTDTYSSTSYYSVPTGATAIRITSQVTGLKTAPYLEVDQIRRVSRLPASSTNRQKQAGLYPGGSAPAAGSLHVSHPTTALGKAFVYTYPLGRPSPALMQYRTAGALTGADATKINGADVTLVSIDMLLTVPNAQVPVRGPAALWMKMDVFTGPVSITVTVAPTSGGLLAGQTQVLTRTVPVGLNQMVAFGFVNLPGAVVGPTGTVLIYVHQNTTGGPFADIDEVWAFGSDEFSALTIVDAGSGTVVSGGPANNLWINAPTVEKPAGEVLIGTSVDDARWPLIYPATQIHRFPRDGVSVLFATFGAADCSIDFTHYKRWTHHAAETS